MEDMPGTINTAFFCDKYIDSIINFKDSLIEGKVKMIIIIFIHN